MSDHIAPDDWKRLACEELDVAKILHRERKYQQSFYHAGMVVECALNYQIMRRSGLNRWPDRKEQPDLHVHELIALARSADIECKLLALREDGSDPAMLLAWQIAKDWTVRTRYDPRPFPPVRADGMIDAVGGKGLLAWISGQ